MIADTYTDNEQNIPLTLITNAIIDEEAESNIIRSVSENKTTKRIIEKKHKCMVQGCPYSFEKPSKLKRHMFTHTGEKPFVCQHCNYKTARKDTFQLHLRKGKCGVSVASGTSSTYQAPPTSPSASSFSNPVAISFSNPNYIPPQGFSVVDETSVPFIHVAESGSEGEAQNKLLELSSNTTEDINVKKELKKFACDLCNYSSSRKQKFEEHVRTHTGEKPFKCQNCAYAATRKEGLNNHIKRGKCSNVVEVDEPSLMKQVMALTPTLHLDISQNEKDMPTINISYVNSDDYNNTSSSSKVDGISYVCL